MAFNFLQFAVPHGKGLIRFSDIIFDQLSIPQLLIYSTLVAIMFVALIVHVVLTALFIKGLLGWIADKTAPSKLLNDPYQNVTVFPIIGSLAMSASVFWSPAGFFIPQIAENLQALMLPSLLYFVILWSAGFALEWKVVKVWFATSAKTDKFNFVWLLDAFVFGLVSLAGSGIAATSVNPDISAFAIAGTALSVLIGLAIFVVKLTLLITALIKTKRLYDNPVLPAFFLVVPIACLYGLSLFRVASYFQTFLQINISGTIAFIMSFSYFIAVGWVIFAVFLLGYYFKNYFLKSNYSAPQWGIV